MQTGQVHRITGALKKLMMAFTGLCKNSTHVECGVFAAHLRDSAITFNF